MAHDRVARLAGAGQDGQDPVGDARFLGALREQFRREVISAGFRITQLPAASAEDTFIPMPISGPFQVLMIPTMPIGSGTE